MARQLILKNQRTNRDVTLSEVTVIAENLKIHVMDDEIYIEDSGSVPVVKINSYPLTPDDKYSIAIGDFIEIGKELFRVELVEQKINTASATLPKDLTRVVVDDDEDNDRTDPQIVPNKIVRRSPRPTPTPVTKILEKGPKAKFDPTKWVILAGVLFLIGLSVRKFALQSTQETFSTASSPVAAPIIGSVTIPVVSASGSPIVTKAMPPLRGEAKPLGAAQAVTTMSFAESKNETNPPTASQTMTMVFDPTEFLRLTGNIGERFPTGHHCPDDYALKLEDPSQLELKLNIKKFTCRDYRSDRSQYFRAVMNENITHVSLEYRKPLEKCDAEHLRAYFGTTGEVLKDGPVTWYSPHARADWAETILGDLNLVTGCESNTHLFWILASTRLTELMILMEKSSIFLLSQSSDYKMTPDLEAQFRQLAKNRGMNSERSTRILESGIKESYKFK